MGESRYWERVDAVAAVWASWAATGSALDAAGWATPSRCVGWDVAALFAHVAMFPHAVLHAPAPPADPGTPITAAAVLAGFNEPGGVAHERAGQVAEQAVAGARDTPVDALVAVFADTGRRALEELRGHPFDEPVPWPAAAAVTTWGEAVRLVLLESVVHLYDVLDALGRAPEIPGDGPREAAHLLAEVAGPARFVEAATRRSDAEVLPVLR
ncbi:MAG: maleylpyruvate isomerase N-terminal domain-containing protein [Actinomycetota bacterium]|nr:maleylpyruvate isomerase N-terminal domain-containing protein [Actinomycetota bacterium]